MINKILDVDKTLCAERKSELLGAFDDVLPSAQAKFIHDTRPDIRYLANAHIPKITVLKNPFPLNLILIPSFFCFLIHMWYHRDNIQLKNERLQLTNYSSAV